LAKEVFTSHKEPMQGLLLVAAGGAIGSVARYLLSAFTLRNLGSAWPYGTLSANVLGGLLIGALAGFLAFRGGVGQDKLRLLLQVGFLGGFTTFSAYSLEVALMIERRDFGQAAVYALTSVILSVGALFLGLALARKAFA
jgi:CrcB protein